MPAITVTTLKKGIEFLGLQLDSNKKKELEQAIDQHLANQELGYECPSCSKDIPDVVQCPYCGESFADTDETTDNQQDADNSQNADSEDSAEGLDDQTASDVAEAVSKEVEKSGKNKGKADTKSNTKTDAKSSGKTSAEKAKEEKAAAKAEGRGRPQGKTKSTEEKEKDFGRLIDGIDKIVGECEKRERKTGITYVKDGKRLLKAVSTGKTLAVEFNVPVKSEDDNLVKYTPEEAKAKHLGSTTAIYSYGDETTALKFVAEAFKNLK